MADDARRVARAYLDAFRRRDPEAMASCWAPAGVDTLVGQAELLGPDAVRAFFGELFAAIPDLVLAVDDVVVEGEKAAVRWHAAGTFAGTPYQGIEATGQRVALAGTDLLEVRDGLLHGNFAFADGLGFARQIGMLPTPGTPAEARTLRAFNAATRATRRLAGAPPEPVADGVWRVRGGVPRAMNVYLVEEQGGGVCVFDAGVSGMARAVAAAAVALGGIQRVVLGHGHVDHRGTAGRLGAPVFCHADARAEVEGDGGASYVDLTRLRAYARPVYRRLLAAWDGGPVPVAATLAAGEEVGGFRVVEAAGHAPGMIALFRERDGVALTSDAFYTLDVETGRHCPPRLPPPAFTLDEERARTALAGVAALEPSAAWPGHAGPVTGDVRAQLERALG